MKAELLQRIGPGVVVSFLQEMTYYKTEFLRTECDFLEFTSVDASQHVFVHACKQASFFTVSVLPVEENQMICFHFQVFGDSVIKGNGIPVKLIRQIYREGVA